MGVEKAEAWRWKKGGRYHGAHEIVSMATWTRSVVCRGLNTAMVGLQGSGPLVSLELEVLNSGGEFSPAASEPSSSSASSFDHVGEHQARTSFWSVTSKARQGALGAFCTVYRRSILP